MIKNRIELARYFAELGFKKGAEIGVLGGYYSHVLLETIPDLNLLSIDPWSKYARVYPDAVKLLSPYPNSTILRATSLDVVKMITDESLDFVYIDGDHHYEPSKNDIKEWTKKVRMGGIVAGDDYLVGQKSAGVVLAIDEYAKINNLLLINTPWDDNNPVFNDKNPQWYFVKK